MFRPKLILSVLCVVSACASELARSTPAQPAHAPSQPTAITISVVTTNDLHGRIQQLPLLGGYVANLRRVRAREGGAVLLLDAGDIFQGTLESNLGEGAGAVRAFNALGYTAAAVGNHEFDFGPAGSQPTPRAPGDDPLGALRARVSEARFPFLSANLRAEPDAPFPIAGIVPSVELVVSGVRVAIIGGITEGALTRTHPANTRGLAVAPLAASIRSESQRLRKQGVEVVIATVHAGGECRTFDDPDDLSGCDAAAEVFQLANALAPGEVDLIVGGHTHKGIAHRVNGTPVIEAFSEGRAFGRVDLRIERGRGVTERHIFAPVALCVERIAEPVCSDQAYEGAKVERDASVVSAIADDMARAASERARILGVDIVGGVRREHDSESALGNLVADLMREASPGAVVAVNNGGSVRASLPAGKLTYGQLFEVFPFDNVLATVELSAAELGAMIADNLQNDRGFLALSGVRARAKCVGSALRVELLAENGTPLPPSKRLHVVTSDFLATGGDGLMSGVEPSRIRIHETQVMREALVERLSHRSTLDGADRKLFDPSKPRVLYNGARPISCSSSL